MVIKNSRRIGLIIWLLMVVSLGMDIRLAHRILENLGRNETISHDMHVDSESDIVVNLPSVFDGGVTLAQRCCPFCSHFNSSIIEEIGF